ncbi:Acyl-coenzyme A thioesterase PaaI, contains HGG motif [Oceanospirillum multiglobuliferum]|uniref:Tetrameric acyl-CoA thioesterase n=1 Tax=Oceanospirillum multiglobuliferum TaxID=64969 RepID=A0A1T4MNU2_9GAMM|nr:DUF4442 domain-containing protein [Oceanospirillum multiglobuliferum]OPX56942.1 hypothetical protein BTE48_00450 [Oceanospirillum multiglobuliferum]SJZ68770.1 Acyl-coenzyme A thioesterase PaaI, contains HGG motif [Oceanospirillum multiglobuliferum]
MKLKAALLKWGISLWPPLLGAGVKVERLDADFRVARVRMKLRWYNRNYVGVHYGGSLYSMTDPFYMLMLSESLGKGYVVWDKAAHIEYVKPGRSTVWADFQITPELLAQIKDKTANGEKYLPEFEVLIRDNNDEVVARVMRTLYIRRKRASTVVSAQTSEQGKMLTSE